MPTYQNGIQNPPASMAQYPTGAATAQGAFKAIQDAIQLWMGMRQQETENKLASSRVDLQRQGVDLEKQKLADQIKTGDETQAMNTARQYGGLSFDPTSPEGVQMSDTMRKGGLGAALRPETINLAPPQISDSLYGGQPAAVEAPSSQMIDAVIKGQTTLPAHAIPNPQGSLPGMTPTPTGRTQITPTQDDALRAAILRSQASDALGWGRIGATYAGQANQANIAANAQSNSNWRTGQQTAALIAAAGIVSRDRQTEVFSKYQQFMANYPLEIQRTVDDAISRQPNLMIDILTGKTTPAAIAQGLVRPVSPPPVGPGVGGWQEVGR